MTEVLRELFADEFADPAGNDLIEPFPIYVLSNQHRLNGSSCILYQHLLHDFAGASAVIFIFCRRAASTKFF